MFLIRFLLLFFLFSLLLRIIGRAFYVSHRSRNNDESWKNYFREQKKKEGSVTVNLKQKEQSKIFRKNEGEYVQFEDV